MPLLFRVAALLAATFLSVSAAQEARWWRGNLHTHTLWSDGDDFPEMVVEWYKTNGYHFLALSDHNTLQTGMKWVSASDRRLPAGALARYRERFGPDWARVDERNSENQVRLRTLPEFRPLFEETNRFLLLTAEEITDAWTDRLVKTNTKPVHLIATNLREAIKPRGGTSVVEVMQRNVDAVLEQRKKTGQAMFPHIAHPNYKWAVRAEDLMQVKGERFFEVYNGHPGTHTAGDELHAGLEQMWDIVLTHRLARLGLPAMFGMAVDDAHNYHTPRPPHARPGRGWVWVRSSALTAEALIEAMERGDFYASSGVKLVDIRWTTNRLELEIEAEPGVLYRTEFIGTRTGFDARSEPALDSRGREAWATRRYSADIGATFAAVAGAKPAYTLKGDEIYVRARVVSTRSKAGSTIIGEVETAWTQPFSPPAAAKAGAEK